MSLLNNQPNQEEAPLLDQNIPGEDERSSRGPASEAAASSQRPHYPVAPVRDEAAGAAADEERGEAAFYHDQGPAASAMDSQDIVVADSRHESARPDLEDDFLIPKDDRSPAGSSIGGASAESRVKSRSEVNREFMEKQTWELWTIFIMKLVTSLVFLIDDLTFLVFCEYEFNMTQQEAGILFCVSAMFLFAYGLTISGYLIDKLGVKYSLVLGFLMMTVAKFTLTFASSLTQLYVIMCTISPFGISIIFPCLVLGIKKLTEPGPARSLGFSIFYAFMVLGALLGGPLVDFIRRDIGKTYFEYLHTNVETGQVEHRYLEVSAWRAICFFGFLLNASMLILLGTYDRTSEARFEDPDIDHEAIARLTFADIFGEIIKDSKFWRFMLFSFVIVGSKMVFSLLFFMIPKMITQNDGENAPFGIYVSIAPLLIIVFLFFLAPAHASHAPYTLILAGTAIATLGPIPMFFGMNLVDFVLFIVIVAFAEALYSPMINVFTFNFTRAGREGTFLTLTAAPVYFTMALTGVLGGYLLENYYPAVEDATHKRQPEYIWLTIIACSAASTGILYAGRDYFNCKDLAADAEDGVSQGDGHRPRDPLKGGLAPGKLGANKARSEANLNSGSGGLLLSRGSSGSSYERE